MTFSGIHRDFEVTALFKVEYLGPGPTSDMGPGIRLKRVARICQYQLSFLYVLL